MGDQFTTFVERHPGFYQERTSLPLDEMMKREIDPSTNAPTVIRELFNYWQDRRIGALPTTASFDPQGVFTPDKFRWVSWIKLANFDPLNSILCKHPADVFGDWSGRALRLGVPDLQDDATTVLSRDPPFKRQCQPHLHASPLARG